MSERRPIHLSAKHAAQVESLVAAGHYADAESVVAEGLRLIEAREKHKQWLRDEIQKGVDDLDAGRFSDGEVFMRELIEELEEASRCDKPDAA